MTAIANRARLTDQHGEFPFAQKYNKAVLAGKKVWAGGMVGLNSAGTVQPMLSQQGLVCLGVAQNTADNSSSLSPAPVAEIFDGIFSFGQTGPTITNAAFGKVLYAVDDQTVSLDGTGRSVAGVCVGLDDAGNVMVSINPAGAAASLSSASFSTIRVRNVVNANVADLAAYTVAANASNNDNVLGVEGDYVLLVAQTTAAQNGIYRIGAVASGAAPLTRATELPAGAIVKVGSLDIAVSEGDLFACTRWFNNAAVTIATTDPGFYPESVTQAVTLVAGTATISNVPIRSVTKSNVVCVRKVANTSTLTVGGYHPTSGGASGLTAGALGTAAAIIQACVAAGTINNADVSTLLVTIHNR